MIFSTARIDISTDKGIYALEIDHFSEVLLSDSIESNLVSHSDSHGNMIWLDTWRKSIGVYYSEDKPTKREKQMSSFFEDRKSMPTSRIKGIDKELSRVVFGCDNQSDTNHAFAMFDYYFNKGGNVYDTAYIYNNGKSDRYLGEWIKARNNRDEVVILGKGAHTPDCLPEKIRPQLEETLDRLSTNKLDIYFLHRDNPEIPVSEFMDSLNELKNDGLIDVVTVQRTNRLTLFKLFPKIFSGEHINNHNVRYHQVKNISIAPEMNTKLISTVHALIVGK